MNTSDFNICVFKGFRPYFKDIITAYYSNTPQPWNGAGDGCTRCQICNRTNHQASTCFQCYNHTINPYAYLTHQAPIPLTQNWLLDTGASHHTAPDISGFTHVEEYKGPDQLHIGNGQGLPIQNTGSFSFSDFSNRKLSLNNILHVPSITKCLLSVQRFARDNNAFFEFHPDYFLVKDWDFKTLLLFDQSNDGLYSMSIKPQSSSSYSALSATKASSTCWHLHLGHLH
ncbi:hypothetical protein CQW23_24066 [Capsicum baccatum]|uniref:Retrovirus-related Pol polyprotein from transposon TNT 1-94-like beta-barrel domain-containing protein n=1 Tax=Capsicum baccatum TaxID=33114 RepID=A0A2G2VTS2_CAPBA|nr:hypothetical protein CQW23_24066 [Capsicum baccatum]